MLLLRLLGASMLLGNTVTAQGAVVAEAAISSPFNITASEDSEPTFEIMAGCSQGDCPQSNARIDFLSAADMPLTPTRAWIRINRCDKCQQTYNIGKGGGCHKFKTTCLGNLDVCVDPKRMRGHWVEGNTGRKTCVSLKKNVYKNCSCGGGYRCDVSVFTPTEVRCTW